MALHHDTVPASRRAGPSTPRPELCHRAPPDAPECPPNFPAASTAKSRTQESTRRRIPGLERWRLPLAHCDGKNDHPLHVRTNPEITPFLLRESGADSQSWTRLGSSSWLKPTQNHPQTQLRHSKTFPDPTQIPLHQHSSQSNDITQAKVTES